ncbi:MAG: DUF2750 domain-containing protein [Hyphomicrobiaceae bacterium]|nr:DUF2750 domain-containing protein [Hyphomicrobiaceae bacterium]
MHVSARIPDLVQRERFIRKIVLTNEAFFVAGQDGWATVPFRSDPARQVVLFWSSRGEAEKWSHVVADNPHIHTVKLGQLLAEVLPMLTSNACLIGHDWSTDPADPVIAPAELAERIWRERTDSLIGTMRTSEIVWVLESASGPALLPSSRISGRECLPVWASREAAAFNAAGSWSNKRPLGVKLSMFRERYVPFVSARDGTIGPEPMPEAGMREMTPQEFTTLAYPAMTLSRLRSVG